MDLKTLDVKAHLQKCPSPVGCFPRYPKGTGACVSWVSGDCLRNSTVGQKKTCVWCLSGFWASQRIWLVTDVSLKGQLHRRDFSLLASTYQVVLKAERICQMLILKMKFDLPTASFALPFLLTQKRVNICYSQAPMCLLQTQICMKLSTTKAFWQ